MEQVKNRNIGIDVLRVLLIIFIIMHHLLLKGVGLRSLTDNTFDSHYVRFAFTNAFLIVAVNTFFLISGYYGIKWKPMKILKLALSVYIIYGFINLLFIIMEYQSINYELLKGLAFPISQYWFVFVYLILSLLAPYINQCLDKLDMGEHRKLLIILIVIWCGYAFLIDNEVLGANRGYSISFAIILYILGSYIKKVELNRNSQIKPYLCCMVFIVISIINGVLVVVCILNGEGGLAWLLYSYNNPLVLMGSVCLFLTFSNSHLYKWESVSKVGKYTLYIYIVHSTPVFSNCYMSWFERLNNGNSVLIVMLLLVFMCFLFTIGLVIGIIYEVIWKKISKLFICSNFKI